MTQLQAILKYLWTYKRITSLEANRAGNTTEGRRYVFELKERKFIGHIDHVKTSTGAGRPYNDCWLREGLRKEDIDFEKCAIKS